jgi:hypothetical protein
MAQQTIENRDTGLTARTKINDNFTELYGGSSTSSFVFSDTEPDDRSASWVDTSSTTIPEAFPIKRYIDGAWTEESVGCDWYDAVGNVISRGRPFTLLTWGQSNLAACYYQEFVGARTPGYLSSSATSLNTATIVRGDSITATIGTGLSYVPGDYVNFRYNSIAVASEMWGNVTAYNSVSGSITFTVIVIPSTGGSSYSDWIVTRELPGDISTDNHITLWNPDDEEWFVPDVANQQEADYPFTYWAWNLNVHGTTNIQVFAKKFAAEGRSIRIVQWRKGGVGLEYFLPGGEGYDFLVASATSSGVAHFDLIIGAQGEGGYSGAYSSYIEALYEGFIPSIRSEAFADESTGLIMPSTALGIAQYPLVPASYPSDYAIRSLNYSWKNTGWAQGRPFKGIIIPNSQIFPSTTSVNLATATFPITIFKAAGGSSLVGDGPYIVASRADDSNFIECSISAHNTGTGQLTLIANTAHPMGSKGINGTGTHTDWDILVQDYIHEAVSDHVSLGNACYEAYKMLGSGSKAQPISTSRFDYDNNYTRQNRVEYPPSDDTQIDYRHIAADGLFKTEVFGGPSKVFVTGDGRWRFAASVDGTTAATLSDETFQMGSFGVKAAKGVWFTDYLEASPWANTSVKKAAATRDLEINVADNSFGAYDAHLKIFFGGDVVTPALDFYEGGSANASEFNLAGKIKATQFKLVDLNTAPANASDTGTKGEIRIDANHIYICTATNTWKRVAIATW